MDKVGVEHRTIRQQLFTALVGKCTRSFARLIVMEEKLSSKDACLCHAAVASLHLCTCCAGHERRIRLFIVAAYWRMFCRTRETDTPIHCRNLLAYVLQDTREGYAYPLSQLTGVCFAGHERRICLFSVSTYWRMFWRKREKNVPIHRRNLLAYVLSDTREGYAY
jgi:hypothetical protein